MVDTAFRIKEKKIVTTVHAQTTFHVIGTRFNKSQF